MKNSSDTMGNRTRDLPTCSAVPQQTALLRAPNLYCTNVKCTVECDSVCRYTGREGGSGGFSRLMMAIAKGWSAVLGSCVGLLW